MTQVTLSSSRSLSKWQSTSIVLGLCAVGLAVRLALVPFDQPLKLDAELYYYYAAEIAYHNHLPVVDPQLHNLGFPYFLSFFFSLMPSDQMLLQNTQRIITAVLSVGMIPLAYKLARRYYPTWLSLIGAAMFAFEPRLVTYAGSGITDPLALILSLGALILVTSKNTRLNFAAYGLVLLASTVRFEAILLFGVLILIHARQCRQLTNVTWLFLIMGGSVGLVYGFGLDSGILDATITKIEREIHVLDIAYNEGLQLYHGFYTFDYIMYNSFLHLGWAFVPAFVTFPIGLYYCRRKRQYLWLICTAILSVSGLFAYIDAWDMRYFFPIYPFLMLVSLNISKIFNKILVLR